MIDSFQALVDLLEADGVPHRVDAERTVIAIPVQKRTLTGAMRIDWLETVRMVQLVLPLPVQVGWDRRAEMESALIRVNHSLPLQGFALHPSGNPLYFRATIVLGPEGVTATQIRRCFGLVSDQASLFLPQLQAVASGELGADAIGPPST